MLSDHVSNYPIKPCKTKLHPVYLLRKEKCNCFKVGLDRRCIYQNLENREGSTCRILDINVRQGKPLDVLVYGEANLERQSIYL